MLYEVITVSTDRRAHAGAGRPELAQGGHYSSRNARYDWLTLNHFADISGADVV